MEINHGRWTADIDGDFVVFLIGARVQDPEHPGPAVGLLMAMVDMLGELVQDPSPRRLTSGFARAGRWVNIASTVSRGITPTE